MRIFSNIYILRVHVATYLDLVKFSFNNYFTAIFNK